MKRTIITLSISAFMAVLPCLQCYGQRTAQDQWSISADCSIKADIEGISPSAQLDVGRYTRSGIVSAGFASGYSRHRISKDISMDLPSIQTHIGYALRVAGSYTRAVSLYMNSSVTAGMEFPDPGKRLPHWIESDLPSSLPYAEISLGPSIEVFMTKRAAATLTILTNARTTDIQHCPSIKTSIGVRVNI